MALIEKGILSASHYEVSTPPSINLNLHGRHSDSVPNTTATSLESPRSVETEGGDRGVYL